MDYKHAWDEQKEWLEKSIAYLDERMAATKNKDEKEHARLKSKREGMSVSLGHMTDSERIYK